MDPLKTKKKPKFISKSLNKNKIKINGNKTGKKKLKIFTITNNKK